MKTLRHKKILDIVNSRSVTTQEELQKFLEDAGFVATQATISRDIKDLRLIKALSPNGSYYYTTPHEKIATTLELNINTVFLESIKSVDGTGTFVVVKCFSGMANAVCASIDNGQWEGLVGTIAGDDTIFLLLRTEEQAQQFSQYVRNIINGLNR